MADGKFTKLRKKIIAADMWCGGGGTSTGLSEAVKELGYDLELTAVNHWEIAVATHTKNHPNARHFCKTVDSLSPLELFPDRRIKLLVASPECVGHSKARGGAPTTEQRRADAWDIQRWTEKLFIENLIIENVEEFTQWGPLDSNGRPLKSKKGLYFKQFIDFLNLTYTVEWKILNCADYGDATTRKRFFLLAKRGKNKKISFPAPTHASRKVLESGQQHLFNQNDLKQWVSAREIINWDLKGKNIFGRKKSLSENTMRRIYAGLRKYSGIDIPERQFSDNPEEQKEFDKIYQTSPIKIDFSKFKGFTMGTGGPTGQLNPRSADEPVRTILTDHRQNVFAPKVEPFVLPNEGFHKGNSARKIEEPIPTVTSRGGGNVIEPFLINQKGTTQRMREIDEPSFTQTAASVGQYLCQPYMVNLSHTSNKDEGMCKDLETPLPVICGKGMLGVVEPFIIPCNHGKDGRTQDIDDPMKTITGIPTFGIAEPYLVKYNTTNTDGAHSSDEPISTITTKDRLGLAEPFLVQYFGGMTAVSVDNPVPTITANYEHYALVTPFAVKFNNNEDAKDLNEPVPTITTKDKIGLGQPFMIQFFGERDGQKPRTRDIDSPVWTVTPQIRQGIVEPFLVKLEDAKGKAIHGLLLMELGAILVVNFRMLHQTELAAAMSFPADYYFHGTRDQQVRQIGNAVPVKTAKALCKAILQK